MDDFKYTLMLIRPSDQIPTDNGSNLYWEKLLPILDDVFVWLDEEGLVANSDYIRPNFHKIIFKDIDIWVMAQLKFGG
jgi:hypothetical protein